MTVLAETTVEFLVSDNITLPRASGEVNSSVAGVRDLRCFVITNMLIFEGILRNQIILVDPDGVIGREEIDIPFSGFVNTPGVSAGSACELTADVIFVGFELLTPVILRGNIVIRLGVIVINPPQDIIAATERLPAQPVRFVEPGAVRVSAPGFHY